MGLEKSEDMVEEVELTTRDVEGQVIPSSSAEGGSSSTTKKRITKTSKPGMVVKKKRKVKHQEEGDATAKFIKYAAMFLLVAQMVGLVLLMRYSRTHRSPDTPLYLASSAVFVMEVMKFLICCVVITVQSGGDLIGELQEHVIGAPTEVLKLCVPSVLYTIQNNLLYLALTNLDAATYQVCYQLKILTTAVFSAILLHVRYNWLCTTVCDMLRLADQLLVSCLVCSAEIFTYQMGFVGHFNHGSCHCPNIRQR